jgi:hypothetical protein
MMRRNKVREEALQVVPSLPLGALPLSSLPHDDHGKVVAQGRCFLEPVLVCRVD